MVVKKIPKKCIFVVILVIFLSLFIGSYYTGKFTDNAKLTDQNTINTSILPTSNKQKVETTSIETTSIKEGLTGVVLAESTSDKDCEDLGCPVGTQFVGSKNSDKYHNCDCRWAKNIKPDNLVCFKNLGEAKDKGYVPCKTCKPLE